MLFVRRNFGYKLMALVISVLLYTISHNQLNPHTTNEVYIQPAVVDVPEDLVVRTGPTGFTVTVAGPVLAIAAFKSEPVKATVDISRARLGLNKLPLQYKLPSGDLDIGSAPVYAEVSLDHRAKHEWYVDIPFDNEPPPGYSYQEPVATPRKVNVSGLASEVARVARVIAVVPKAQGAWEVNDQAVDLIAQNASEQTVDTVQIDPPRVQVHIGLRQALTSKALLLSAVMTDTPAAGCVISGYSFLPPMVTVSGTQLALANRSSLTIPVSVAGATASFTRTVPVRLPSGLKFDNPAEQSVRVTVEVRRVAPESPTLHTTPISPPPHSLPTPSVAPTSAAQGVP